MANLLQPLRVVGRYSIYQPFASGGMATVHLAHMAGSAGFSRVVAVKRMKQEFVHDSSFATMFQDEATLAARVLHPNVVATLDVVRDQGELMIVMEYVRGIALRQLMEGAFNGAYRIPVDIALTIIGGVLEGLHAAHTVRGDDGKLLGLVHRDISPPNILVGRDGVPKIVDFGIAKAFSKLHVTATHEVRGKLSYLPPERILQRPSDHRVDIFACGVVLWEMLAGRKRYVGANVGEVVNAILTTDPPLLHSLRPDVSSELDRVLLRATAREPEARYGTAEAMLADLERVGSFASKRALALWLSDVAATVLGEHEDLTRKIRAQHREVEEESGAPLGFEPTFVEPLPTEETRTLVLKEMPLRSEPEVEPATLAFQSPLARFPGPVSEDEIATRTLKRQTAAEASPVVRNGPVEATIRAAGAKPYWGLLLVGLLAIMLALVTALILRAVSG
jgi:eukaryotic-like serine/threonine-protein kinase